MTMDTHAVWFTDERVAEVLEESVPNNVGPEDILVRARRSLISAGTEMTVYRGERDTDGQLAGAHTASDELFPIKYGYQVVGKVVEAGTDSGFTVGDMVFAYHPHQSRFVLHRDRAYPVPKDLPLEAAAFGNLYCVAMTALLDAPVRPGDVVVVTGAGVVGALAATIARRTAGTLILVEPIESRAQRAAALCNPDAVVHPDKAIDVINELSGGRGADVWVEASGSPAALQLSLRAIGVEGTIVVASYFGNRTVPLTLSTDFLTRRPRIVSSFVSYLGSGLQPRWDARRRMAYAMKDLARIDVQSLITHQMPFADAGSCYRLIDNSPNETMAVLLDYDVAPD